MGRQEERVLIAASRKGRLVQVGKTARSTVGEAAEIGNLRRQVGPLRALLPKDRVR